MGNGTSSTMAIFAGGAVGGVALDILGLYFTGFPEGHNTSWFLGRLVVVLLFMAMTGFLAWVYSNGQLKTAFVIGVAAPSILLNIAASVQMQKPMKDVIPTIPSIPALGSKPSSSLDAPVRVSLLGVSVAEAQQPVGVAQPTLGQLKVAIGKAPAGVDALKDGELMVFTDDGKLIGKAVPSSHTFLFALPAGKYKLQYSTPNLQSQRLTVTIDGHQINEIALPVAPMKTDSSSSTGWDEFLNGAGSQFKKVNAVK